MSPLKISHVTLLHESGHTYEWVAVFEQQLCHITHVNAWCYKYQWVMSHLTNESCHTYQSVMSLCWMSQVKLMNESWYLSHVTLMNETCHNYERFAVFESCHTYEWVMSQLWIHHVTLPSDSVSHLWKSHGVRAAPVSYVVTTVSKID